MFRFMRTITLNAFSLLDSTHECEMTPLLAICVLEYTRVHICSSDCSDVVAYIEASVDEKFCVLTALHILNIDLDYGYIWLGRDFDDSWLGREGNVIENMILFHNGFDIQWSKFLLRVRMSSITLFSLIITTSASIITCLVHNSFLSTLTSLLSSIVFIWSFLDNMSALVFVFSKIYHNIKL